MFYVSMSNWLTATNQMVKFPIILFYVPSCCTTAVLGSKLLFGIYWAVGILCVLLIGI